MATRLYSINVQDNEFAIVEATGSAVVTKSIELTVDLGTTPQVTKNQVILALEQLRDRILKDKWPPQ